jgi:hypothetical protein
MEPDGFRAKVPGESSPGRSTLILPRLGENAYCEADATCNSPHVTRIFWMLRA